LGDFLGPTPADQSEDCLFLDIYVPKSATQQRAAQIPVVVWFFGGAYAFGTKDINQTLPLYTGQSMLQATKYGAIFVAGNYRLGAFGWLAGNYMQGAGRPNAGLYDQGLLLEWVRDYIHLVGGDNTSVSAWGESAGGGSILHHLIRRNGTAPQDPLFQTFLVQSPAFQWSWDNSPGGTLDSVYRNFSQLSGCGYGYNITCLQEKDIATLANANQKLFNTVPQTGLFPLGPSVDTDTITQIPTISYANSMCFLSRLWLQLA
jgi:carboxylesterase type B